MPQQPGQSAFSVPFGQYLDPEQPAEPRRINWDQGAKFSGWEGKAGIAAGMFNSLAEGLSQGKLRAFQKNQQESANQLKIISAFTQSQMQRTDLSEAKKNDLLNWQNRAYAQILYPQVKEHTKAEGFGGHAAKAVSSIFGAMGGVNEAGKANPYGPDTFHGLLNAATADVEDPRHTIQAKIDEATKLWQAQGIADINKRAELRGAVAPDMRDFQASPIASQVMGLYRQAGPQQLKEFMDGLPYPGAGDYKAQAAAGYEALGAQDTLALKKRALPDVPPSAAPPQGYLARQPGYLESQVPAAPAVPPDFPTTPGEYGRMRPMNPQEKAEDEQHQQMREYLGGILGIHPDVPYKDPVSGTITMVPKDWAAALNAQRGMDIRATGQQDLKTYRNSRLEQYRKKNDNDWTAKLRTMGQRDRALNIQQHNADTNSLRELTYRHALEDRKDSHAALAGFLLQAAENHIPIADLPTRYQEVLLNADDPDMLQYADQIGEFVRKIKTGQDYSALAAALSGNPAPAAGSPPAATTAAPPKPAVPTGGAGAQIFNQLRKPGK